MSERPTLLLIHGAWHGAWAWNASRELLEERGWRVSTVDLPTVHAADPTGLSLSDDAAAVAEAIDAITGSVVVIAHSYGGVPTTQAAAAESVEHIVYVSAFALDVGESLLAAVGGEAPSWWDVRGSLVSAGTPQETPTDLFFHDVDPPAAAAAVAQLRPQSRLAFEESLTVAAWHSKPSTFIVTEQDRIFAPEAQEALATRAGSRIVRMDTSHSPFLSQPKEFVDAIEEAIGR